MAEVREVRFSEYKYERRDVSVEYKESAMLEVESDKKRLEYGLELSELVVVYELSVKVGSVKAVQVVE